MPLVKTNDLNLLIDKFLSADCKKICVPESYKKIGNPIIFPVKILKMILRDIDTEDRDTGLKSIIKKYNPNFKTDVTYYFKAFILSLKKILKNFFNKNLL